MVYSPSLSNFLNLFLALTTGIILLILAYKVLRKGLKYRLNQLFALTLVFAFNIMLFFPIGGFYIDLAVFTTKIYIQSAHFTLIFMFWSVTLIYLGEENWRNPYLITGLIATLFFCIIMVWFSNSVTILSTEPELDMKIDYPLLLTTASLAISLGTGSLVLLVKSYRQTDKNDHLVLKQIRMFFMGYCIILLALPLQFISESMLLHLFDKLGQILVVFGFLVISLGFFSDVSLASIKIRSNLFRARVLLLNKGKITRARNILEYCKELANREGLDKILLDITFLEQRLLCIDLHHEKALELGADIKSLAHKYNRLDEWKSMQHNITIQKASHDLSSSMESKDTHIISCDLNDSIKYLDMIIQTISNPLSSK